MEEGKIIEGETIELSPLTIALVENLEKIKKKSVPNDFSKISVSETASFLARIYEKLRNAIEFQDDHLVRRSAIERMIKRILSVNPKGTGSGEELLRELLWAKYFPHDSLGEEDAEIVQNKIDKCLYIKKTLLVGRDKKWQKYYNEFLIDLLTCEIEEYLTPDITQRDSNFTYFIYQTIKEKIKIEGEDDKQKDLYLLTALYKNYRKSNKPYLRYYLFNLYYDSLFKNDEDKLKTLSSNIPIIFKKIDETISNSSINKLTKFIKNQLPPYLILFELFNRKKKEIKTILSNTDVLWHEVDLLCREKYDQTSKRLQGMAVRSLIYIFITKMLFALILEYPVSMYLYHEVHMVSIVINSVFPPILMLIIVLLSRIPGDDNTKKIYHHILDLVDKEKASEIKLAAIAKKSKVTKPVHIFGFSIFYLLTFVVTFSLINQVLSLLYFNTISKIIFVFFVSVVTFFSYRVKQVAKEYRVIEKQSIFTPFTDFFFMPILSIGKFLSGEISKLNFFGLVFDGMLETPYKFLVKIIEEWNFFVKKRKDEISY